jgi:membrane protease YdiL (CAAX protease family)
MENRQKSTKFLALFFILAFTFSWAFWIPEILVVRGAALPEGFKNFLSSPWNLAAFGPTLAGLLVAWLSAGGKGLLALLKRGVNLRFKKIWLLPTLLLPVLIFGLGTWAGIALSGADQDLSVLSNPPFAIVAFFVILISGGPLQEEFGWRGTALPALQNRYNSLYASLILGVIWWLWHLPLVFIPGKFMTNDLGLFLALLVEITLMSILFTWIYNRTNGSVLTALLFHTSMNWSIWAILPEMKMSFPIIIVTILLLGIATFIVMKKWGVQSLGKLEHPE